MKLSGPVSVERFERKEPRMRLACSSLLVALLFPQATLAQDLVSARARMSKADAAEEHWDLDARFESGHFVMARFFITNAGPGIHTAVATGHIVFPDGHTKPFTNGRRVGKWRLANDGLLLDVGSSDFDLAGPVRRLDVDNHKRGIKIHLKIQADPARARSEPLLPGYQVDLLDLAAPVSGSLWTSEMTAPVQVRGHATLTHSWMDRAESSLVQQRIDTFGRKNNRAIWFQRLTTPSGETRSWLLIEEAGRPSYSSTALETSLQGRAPGWDKAEYPIPAHLELGNAGVIGGVDLQRIVLSHDPSQDLPQPFRLLLSFRSRPWRVWTDSSIAVNMNGSGEHGPPQLHAAGTTSVTFLNPTTTP